MASSETFNIISSAPTTNSSGTALILTIQPLPTTVNGSSVSSPYSTQFIIASPTPAQLSKYVYGAQITLTTDT